MSDAAALPEHYRRLLAPIRAKCRRMLGDATAAEDATQEAFLRLLRSGPPLSGPDQGRTVMAWLYRTCTRIAIDILRDRRRSEPFSPQGEPTATPRGARVTGAGTGAGTGCSVDLAVAIEARSMLEQLASTVPADELEAALLCRVDGLKHPEAAGVMGVSERTVRRLLDRFDARAAGMQREDSP